MPDTIGTKLLQLRDGRSPEWLAQRADVAATTIRRIESGDQIPKVDRAIRIARALGVTADWLFDPTTEYPPPPPCEEDSLRSLVRLVMEGAAISDQDLWVKLTPDELRLISAFRQMSEIDQAKLLGWSIRAAQMPFEGQSTGGDQDEERAASIGSAPERRRRAGGAG